MKVIEGCATRKEGFFLFFIALVKEDQKGQPISIIFCTLTKYKTDFCAILRYSISTRRQARATRHLSLSRKRKRQIASFM